MKASLFMAWVALAASVAFWAWSCLSPPAAPSLVPSDTEPRYDSMAPTPRPPSSGRFVRPAAPELSPVETLVSTAVTEGRREEPSLAVISGHVGVDTGRLPERIELTAD